MERQDDGKEENRWKKGKKLGNKRVTSCKKEKGKELGTREG